ncbi:MAG TPA: cytochrome c [Vicinamibacterales bacterium]|nr:cytochrome c [Vicinamibacterales bacterium]
MNSQGHKKHRYVFFILGAIAAACSVSVLAQSPSAKPLGIGRAASPQEIAKIDIDVRPDGHGLPDGKGTSAEGAKIYATKCQSCHGANGMGGSADRLVDRESGKNWDFATNAKLVKTVGNYWPYATTLYDYTNRAMPFTQPGTLTPDETYSLVAYILALNKIIPEDAVMDRTTLPKVEMPSKNRFVIDNRKGGKVVK